MADVENVTLTVTNTAGTTTTTTNTLSQDDISAITDLINNETNGTNTFNTTGIIVGASLLGGGLALSLASMVLQNTRHYKYKRETKNLCTLLGIPLMTSGLILTTIFSLHHNKTQNELL